MDASYDVLILDSDPDVLECIADTLRHGGLSVVTHLMHPGDDVHQYVSLVSLKCPRLVVYDLGPPPMRHQLERWLRITDACPKVRFIFMTTNDKLVLEPINRQGHLVVVKPMGAVNLLQVIKAELNKGEKLCLTNAND